MKNRLIIGAISILAIISLAACGSSSSGAADASSAAETAAAESSENVTIKVGASITPHSEILYKAVPILAEEGITLEVVEIEDVVTPNTGLAEGSLDANYFQHQPYLDIFNEENGTDLVSIGAIHYEPYGIYAGRVTSLDAVSDGAKIAVPNNASNEARALLLLEQIGLIKLNEDVGIIATVQDIKENPKNIEIVEIDPSQLVRSLPDVDLAVINGNYAIEGGLSVKDALAVEDSSGLAAQTYANIVVVRSEDAQNEALLELVKVLQSDEIQKYIEDTYDGAVVPLK